MDVEVMNYNQNNDCPYKITSHKKTLVGRFTIVQDTILIDGKEYPYSYDYAGDCVCVLPIYKDRIVLIKEYRHAINQWMLELPAGGIEEGENLIDAAKRELLEEAGYVARKIVSYGKYPISHGTSSAMANLFVAVCDRYIGNNAEPTEFIRVEEVEITRFEEMIQQRLYLHMAGITLWHLAQSDIEEYLQGTGVLS